ncbi:hypothetical protein [Paradevosia shaoguanensis]|uniref:Uncharacterized protein n=1 Tax=Paradevosia shaoguanensis TaxID=1335043 RepID=A0AA41QQL8_9HYPH|nr:hypothetical protein [Paradevosia shaoguanensis]MCF1744285.1 hypothetical protein [Paradevosia shaoguanensis]MCI0128768.1 hypothetical protein [Paradevosia shaoguanensis]
MHDELYADGVGEITVTGSIVRINLVSLSPTEKDEHGNPRAVFRQRIVMPVDAFANAVDLMQKAQAGLVEAGAIRRLNDLMSKADEAAPQVETSAAPPAPNASPNFN